MKRIGSSALLGLAFVLAAQVVSAQGVKVALVPAALTVTPGTDFDLEIDVTRAGAAFNAFDIYIGYDPAALTFVQQTPISLQEGSYFVAACSNRFHRFQPGVDRDTITDALLCAATSLTGPGQIYKLRFHASNTVQVTKVRFLPGLQFYNAGVYVNPDSSSDATIGIGVPLAVAPPTVQGPRVRLVALPNPARGRVAFRVETDRPGHQQLLVTDLQGRIVRRVQDGTFPSGSHVATWDGKSDSGLVAPPGTYMARIHVPGSAVVTRFTLLR